MHAEFEVKYDADDDVEVPDLVELFGPHRAADAGDGTDGSPWAEGQVAEHHLEATYLDTAELDLAAAGLTLRRRTGGEDAGWHLKVPMADGSRSEVRLDLAGDDDAVPAELLAMTFARTLGRPLVPVARVQTHRVVRRLVDATGRVLVEVADDRVTARRLHPSDASGEVVGAATAWREVEVEVVDGPRDLLAAADPALRACGLRPAATASKLARTLALEEGSAPVRPEVRGTGRTSSSASAADVVLAHVTAQVEQIRSQDLPVRLDAPGAVHAMRVATRRLRSSLTTFGPVVRRSATRPLARELRWLARVLGTVRDAEVLRDRVDTAVGQDDDAARLRTTVADEVGGRLEQAYRTAHEALVAELGSERYRALLVALDALVTQPPFKDRAARPARRVLPGLVADSYAEVRSAMRVAREHPDASGREAALHDARKAAKRARYAAEAVAVVSGKDAKAFAAAMEGVQEALGEHLDAVNAGVRLRELAEGASSPSAAFTLGRLHAWEELRAQRSLTDVDDAWARASRKRLRRWLR